MKNIRKIVKIYHKRRAVSPILAAILLIGLAVAAGAILFVVVLPLISGTAKVEFVSAIAADRNDDGLLDQITVKIQNSGSEADSFSEGVSTLTGWSVAGNVEIGLANPVNLIFKTTEVDQQVSEGETLTITLSFDTSADIVLAETDVDMDHAATLTQSDMLIDFTSVTGRTAQTDTTTGLEKWWGNDATAGVDSTHSGTAGLRIRSDNGNPGCYFNWVKSSVVDATPRGTMTDYTNQLVTWDKSVKPVLSFWIKSDILFGTGELRVYITAYDGQTEQGDFYKDIDTNYLETNDGYLANTWVRVLLDMSVTSNWTGFEADEIAATTAGCFTIYVDNNFQANWDIYIDDVSVHSALA